MTSEKRINEQIRAQTIRLIDDEGKQVGIISLRDAIKLAHEKGLDLVEVASDSNPKVCKIMDFGKFKYQMTKRAHEARKRQHIIQIKEVKFRLKTEEHDYQFKIRNAKRFLSEGNKVKISVHFRGREIMHPERGKVLLEKISSSLEEDGTVEMQPRFEGRSMVMILTAKN